MSDLEERVSAALADGAEAAPGAGGLAAGARRRAAVRRRRRVAVGAVVAVLAVVVPLGVVRGLAGDDGTREVAAAGKGWKTISFDVDARADVPGGTLLVDVPEDWVELASGNRCQMFVRWGRPGSPNPCLQVEAMGFATERSLLDYATGPGLRSGGTEGSTWVGHVSLVEADVTVSTKDQQVAQRVLGSARLQDEQIPDLSPSWAEIQQEGLDFQVPATAAGNVEIVVDDVGEETDGSWRAVTELVDGRTVRVDAPTVALAQVISGSSRPATRLVGWTTVTLDDVSVDVPEDWSELDPAVCTNDRGAEVGPPRPQTSGIHPCDAATSVIVVSEDERDPDCCPAADLDRAVRVGGRLVIPQHVDDELARRILASARPEGTPAPQVAEWETVEVGEGYTADVPVGGAVQVSLSEADVDCVNPGGASRAYLRDDGRWAAGFCGDRYVDVVAPTQALADVVALSVRPGPDARWVPVTVESLELEVPSDWQRHECGANAVRFVPPGSPSCAIGESAGVLVVEQTTAGTRADLTDDYGVVQQADLTVAVNDVPFETVRRILASVRPEGTPLPDVATWRTVDGGNGVTAVVPGDPDVDVDVSGAIPSCREVAQQRATERPDGTWRVDLCRNRIVTITAPTQALADVVTLQLRGW